MATLTPAPSWNAIAQLYSRLQQAERRCPGSTEARDLEGAITILVEGRMKTSDPRHQQHDAVRRARFLRLQADRKRAPAVARMAAALPRAHRIAHPEPRQGDIGEPVNTSTPEHVAVARDLVRTVGRRRSHGAGRHAPEVLVGLLAQEDASVTALAIGISRSTVDRCASILRSDMRQILESADAA